jgi:hypothetical protein
MTALSASWIDYFSGTAGGCSFSASCIDYFSGTAGGCSLLNSKSRMWQAKQERQSNAGDASTSFCENFAGDCGGWRDGRCSRVNTNKIARPSQEQLHSAKEEKRRKAKHKRHVRKKISEHSVTYLRLHK